MTQLHDSTLDKIPSRLRDYPNWFVWKYEVRKEKGKDKRTKIPYQSNGRGMASTTNPQTWGSLEAALRAYRAGSYAGIGFVFTNSPFMGFDIDHCINEAGQIDEKALDIIRRLNSYTEISPSGTGIHVIIEASLPPGGNRKGAYEMYDSGRYFTFSGDHVPGTPDDIEARQSEINAVHAEIFPAKPEVKPGSNGNGHNTLALDDTELLYKAMNASNGVAFKALWSGDTSGYPSHSEADYALLGHLRYWTANDAGRMDRLFRQSGLYRPEKWDRLAEKTIQSIIDTGRRCKAPKRRRKPPITKMASCHGRGEFAGAKLPYFERGGSFGEFYTTSTRCARARA